MIGRACARHRTDGARRTDRLRDVAVCARFAVGNRLQVAPDLPLERGGFDVERQIDRRRPAIEMRDERAYPFGKSAALAFDRRRRIFMAEILLELLVPVAELHGTESFLRA